MVVNQQAGACGVVVFGKTGQMNLANCVRRERLNQRPRITTMVDATDVGVTYVKQQPAARSPHHLGEEGRLFHRGGLKLEIGARVLDQDAATQTGLHLVDVRAHAIERRPGIGHRKKVVEPYATMA